MTKPSLIKLEQFNGLKLKSYCTSLKKIDKLSIINELPDIVGIKPRLVLGHGSNIFFLSTKKKPLSSLVLLNQLKGIEKIEEKNKKIFIRCYAGENWNDFVSWTLNRSIGGLENLTLIPGSVGAAPVQNIGAYGVEICNRISSINAWDFKLKKTVHIKAKDCLFGYRNSIFKQQMLEEGWQNTRYLILYVDFKLWPEKNSPLITSYSGINEALDGQPTPKKISKIVKKIRTHKLPDLSKLPNIGSFFQNPTIQSSLAKKLKKKFPAIPEFEKTSCSSKLSAAWLIEKADFKGYRIGDAGIYDKHSLIVVNHGKACTYDVMKLTKKIQKTIFIKYGIWLIPEPNIISSYEKIAYSLMNPMSQIYTQRG